MNTNYNGVHVPHAPFVVTDRIACWWKLFAEGNYFTRHELPSRLLDVWHVTCFRVRGWVTHVIRGAGREFYQRHVSLLHSRSATRWGKCQFDLKRNLGLIWLKNGRRVHFTICSGTPGRITGSVSWFYINSLGKWSGTNGHYWTDTDALCRTLHIPDTSPLFSLLFASALLLISVAFYVYLDRKRNWLIRVN